MKKFTTTILAVFGTCILTYQVNAQTEFSSMKIKAPSQTLASTLTIKLQCIKKIDQCTQVAIFSYNNRTNSTIRIPEGQFNQITGGFSYKDEHPVTAFQPGVHKNALRIKYPCTGNVEWIIAHPTLGYTVAATYDMYDETCELGVKIFTQCVTQVAPGIYRATFGYKNTEDDTVKVKSKSKNYLQGDILYGEVPQSFIPGGNDAAHEVIFKGNSVKWMLTLPNGENKVATADIQYLGKCLKPIKPFVKCIEYNNDLSITAVFGYDNPNPDTVVIPKGLNNHLIYEDDGAYPVTKFYPGRVDSAFSAKASGFEVRWYLLNFDGLIKVAEANPEFNVVCGNENSFLQAPSYPNPAVNTLALSFNEKVLRSKAQKNYCLKIYNKMGICVKQTIVEPQFSNGNVILDIRDLPADIYMINIVDGTEEHFISRFIKDIH